MIEIKKYAAIDIGSNAMRLLITNIVEEEGKETQFNKSALIRVPIRLGQDAFTVGEISEENIDRMIDAMKAFKLLMKVYKVEKYKACGSISRTKFSSTLLLNSSVFVAGGLTCKCWIFSIIVFASMQED